MKPSASGGDISDTERCVRSVTSPLSCAAAVTLLFQSGPVEHAVVVDAAASIPLGQLAPGRWGRLCAPAPGEQVSRRLRDLGFVPGTRLTIVRRAPFRGAVEIELRGYRICLRPRQLDGLRVVPDDDGARR